ncbi:MAG: OmpA family protein [Alphaproteobacteria bacterium]
MSPRKTLAALVALAVLVPLAAEAQQQQRVRTTIGNQTTTDEIRRSLVPVGTTPQTEVSVAAPIQFKLDSYELTPDAMALLDRIAEALKSAELTSFKFLVEGHTDATGSDTHNKGLSENRAASVFDYLARKGVPANRLAAAGFGEGRLLPGVDPNHPSNRRVEVVRLPVN